MRNRLVTSSQCLACRARTPEAAVHRYHHRRADRRRASWRASKRRKALQDVVPADGWLHSLACRGNHVGTRKCRPIPVYRGEQA